MKLKKIHLSQNMFPKVLLYIKKKNYLDIGTEVMNFKAHVTVCACPYNLVESINLGQVACIMIGCYSSTYLISKTFRIFRAY